jgi:hypothetical protein
VWCGVALGEASRFTPRNGMGWDAGHRWQADGLYILVPFVGVPKPNCSIGLSSRGILNLIQILLNLIEKSNCSDDRA